MIVIDASVPTSVQVTVGVASIDTGNQQRDAHLRTNDFLDAANFPQNTFVSTVGVNFNAVLETGGVMISEQITLEFDISAVKVAAAS